MRDSPFKSAGYLNPVTHADNSPFPKGASFLDFHLESSFGATNAIAVYRLR